MWGLSTGRPGTAEYTKGNPPPMFATPVSRILTSLCILASVACAALAGLAFGRHQQHTALTWGAASGIVFAVLLLGLGIRREIRAQARRPVQPDSRIWVEDADRAADIIADLDDPTASVLSARYAAVDGRRLRRAAETAWCHAEAAGRLTDTARGALAGAFDVSGGAYTLLLAVLARDLIDHHTWQILVGPWCDTGLHLPGGPALEHLTLVLDTPDGVGGWTVLEHRTATGPIQSAASAAQLVDTLARRADVSQAPPCWRLRIWTGVHADITTPAAAEYIADRMAQVAA